MKKELEQKKGGQLKVIDESDELLKMRIISNKLKNHEFNDNEKILEIQKQNQKPMPTSKMRLNSGKQPSSGNRVNEI